MNDNWNTCRLKLGNRKGKRGKGVRVTHVAVEAHHRQVVAGFVVRLQSGVQFAAALQKLGPPPHQLPVPVQESFSDS